MLRSIAEKMVIERELTICASASPFHSSRVPKAKALLENVQINASISRFAQVKRKVIGGQNRIILEPNLDKKPINSGNRRQHSATISEHIFRLLIPFPEVTASPKRVSRMVME